MRLSFYSGLALAMIAADNAKAEQAETRRDSTGLFAQATAEEDSDGEWATFAQS